MDRLWAMEVFVRVTECGSFSRAAESLNLANATVTSCVRNLEKHLGVTLLQRNTRHLRLTDAGERFHSRCRVLLEGVHAAEQEAAQAQAEVRGTLNVEAPIAIGHALLLPALPSFLAQYPGLSVNINLTNQPHALIERGLDLAIRMDAVEDSELVARPLYSASYIVCGRADVADAVRERSPADLDPSLCLGLLPEGRPEPQPWLFARDGEETVVSPEGRLSFNSSDALVSAACRGLGLVCVLDIFVRQELADGRLVAAFDAWDHGGRAFHLVSAKASFVSPKLKAFSDFMLEVIGPQSRPDHRERIPVQRGR
ncbi:LysR family transcriptional regulator [Paraburkholderia unamae]|uniref:DNA-binding transcriptional LysR family regulator n=1 Tax=Paraburkholderia unamae TaxID=219649 RepID=A0ABX5KF21_9BURK|nr:LysR family transcriptional regulator [Paraburkholderia unamae]PVX76966.1 DNA-binding transcriptional LysR family regulator [Paraburkholderia unamae]